MARHEFTLLLRYRDILRLAITPKRDWTIKVEVEKGAVVTGSDTAYLWDQVIDTKIPDIGQPGPTKVKFTRIVVWFGNKLLGQTNFIHEWTPPSPDDNQTKPKGTI